MKRVTIGIVFTMTLACAGPPPKASDAMDIAPKSEGPQKPPPPPKVWSVAVDKKDEMSGERTVVAAAEADRQVEDWLGKKSTPLLMVRCADNELDVMLVTNGPADPEIGNFQQATVTLKLDDGKPWDALCGESTDNESLFVPKSRSLATKMLDASKLTVRWTPFHSSPVTTAFDLSDADEPIKHVIEACPAK